MKLSFKSIGKNLTMIAAAAVVAGSGATVAVFAAIPHSTTGVISACRANADGAIRVIDAEASATCEASETPISWVSAADGDSTHSALLRLEPNSEDATNYVMNSTRSRNIVQVTTREDENNPGYRALCIQVAFNPEEIHSTQATQVGIGGGNPMLPIELRSQGDSNGEVIDYYCGTEYNAIAYLYPEMGNVTAQSVRFSN